VLSTGGPKLACQEAAVADGQDAAIRRDLAEPSLNRQQARFMAHLFNLSVGSSRSLLTP
jgi:hypothetical protein